MLNIENIDQLYYKVVNSPEWKELQEKFNNCDDIFVLGHGGNLAVASHAAIDISRLSNGTKNAICPDSATVVTALINDTDFDWLLLANISAVTCRNNNSNRIPVFLILLCFMVFIHKLLFFHFG